MILSIIKPSQRGELEITDVNNQYIKQGRIDYKIVKGFWSDAGQFESLYMTSSFIRSHIIQNNENEGDM